MPTSVKINDELKQRIDSLAKSKKRTAHWIMRKAIEEYVIREEKRQSFVSEAQQSWKDYQQNGLHLRFDEIADWMNSWGTEQEKAIPECHK
jgi:predicted transcriptional regulator